MFTPEDFAHLQFLEGHWKGMGPGGQPFYEAYDFPDHKTLRSCRYDDVQFTAPSDGSTVTLEDGEIVSRWGGFTWHATEVAPNEARFDPVEAPSSFCWRRVSRSQVEVVQRWTDEAGQRQSYTVTLDRVG